MNHFRYYPQKERLAYLEDLARRREEYHTKRKTSTHHKLSRYSEYHGCIAEDTFEKYSGIPMSENIGFDGGYDFVWKGYTVNVRAAQPNGDLWVELGMPHYADLFALVELNKDINPIALVSPTYCKLMGVISRELILQAPIEITPKKKQPAYTITGSELWPIESILEKQG